MKISGQPANPVHDSALPFVSIIIPVFQAEDTLLPCVASINAQTMSDWELLLVDDGSSDHSLSVCHKLSSSDVRIRVFHQANAGPNAARCAGFIQAKGIWVTFVDADDTLPPSALALLSAATSDDTDIVLGNGFTLHDEQRMCIPLSDFRHLAVRGEGSIGLLWGSLYRRTVISPALFDVPTDIRMGEDYIFWLRLVFSTERDVHIIYDNVYTKGQDHQSSTFRWTAEYAERIHVLRKSSIPEASRKDYLYDMIVDRIDNLFTIAVMSPKHEWIESSFYKEIEADLCSLHRKLPLKQRLFLRLPSRYWRRMYSLLSDLWAMYRSLAKRYRLKLKSIVV